MMDQGKHPIRTVKRPDLLTALCIITFIGSGLGLFTYLLVTLSYDEFMNALQDVTLDLPGIDLIKNANKGFFIAGTVLFGASLFGALQMWKLKKAGFHFYVTAQVLLVLHPALFLKAPGIPYFQILFTLIFILLYGLHLKNMS